MQVSVTFRHMDATEALKDYAHEKVESIAKYFKKNVEAHVVMSVERFLHVADITVHANGFRMKGMAKTESMYASIDDATDKIDRQLKKYKEKIRAHKLNADAARVRLAVLRRAAGDSPDPLRLVRSEEMTAHEMTVDEAAVQMDLSSDNVVVFTKRGSRDVNVLYRRADGTLGLIHQAEK